MANSVSSFFARKRTSISLGRTRPVDVPTELSLSFIGTSDIHIHYNRAQSTASAASSGWTGETPSLRQPLDIEILYVEGVFFDEFAAGFYVFAHERGKDGFAFGDVFELDGQEGATLRVH